MTAPEIGLPQLLNKRQVCARVGIPARRLRAWRENGIVVPSASTGDPKRTLYTREDVEQVAFAWFLTREGMSTQQVRNWIPVAPRLLRFVRQVTHSL